MIDNFSVKLLDDILYTPNTTNSILSSHIFVTKTLDKNILVDDIWNFLKDTYAHTGLKFASYSGSEDLVQDSILWKIIYDGELDNYSNFDVNKICAMSIYKKKFGLKRVGSAGNPNMDKMKKFSAYRKLIITDFRFAWAEVSHKSEKFSMKYGGKNYIIDPNLVKNAFPNLVIEDDGIHYTRTLTSGIKVTKIALGKIKV